MVDMMVEEWFLRLGEWEDEERGLEMLEMESLYTDF